MIYQWKSSTRISTDPNLVGAELEKIEREQGLTPDAIVEHARSETSCLHPLFEWDDTIAAELHRKSQASYIVRHIVVAVEYDNHVIEARAFVSLFVDKVEVDNDGEQEQQYLNITTVLTTPALREQLLSKALKEIEWWEKRYSEFTELAPVLAAIAQMRELVAAN